LSSEFGNTKRIVVTYFNDNPSNATIISDFLRLHNSPHGINCSSNYSSLSHKLWTQAALIMHKKYLSHMAALQHLHSLYILISNLMPAEVKQSGKYRLLCTV